MPEYLSPGVYIEEVPSGAQPIQGVSTSTTGFVGATERGPEGVQLVTSWLEYQRWYGGYPPAVGAGPGNAAFVGTYLPYAVQGFFDNGGQRAYISRVIHVDTGAGASAEQASGSLGGGPIRFHAIGRGEWGNRIAVRFSAATKPGTDTNAFRVTIFYYKVAPTTPIVAPDDPTQTSNPNRRTPDVTEDYDNVTITPGAQNDVIATINAASRVVWAEWVATPPAKPTGINTTSAYANSITLLDPVSADPRLIEGDYLSADTRPGPAVPPSNTALNAFGLQAFETIDDVSIMAIPDQAIATLYPNLSDALKAHCEKFADRFAVMSMMRNQSNVSQVTANEPPEDTSYAAAYYPWIYVYDPVQDNNVLVPPSGHMAGIYADTDIQRGVHKAPANSVVTGAMALEFPVTKGMQDILNPNGVNCIRDFTSSGRGIRLWGARTMSSDPQWRYVNVRRLFIYVEQSINQGTQWVVFEPNDDSLWAAVRRNLTNFLARVWKSGALFGLTEADAFFVKCDQSTMTPDDLDNGRLICYIGIAPVKPAEFVIFRISQKTIDASTQ